MVGATLASEQNLVSTMATGNIWVSTEGTVLSHLLLKSFPDVFFTVVK